MSKPGAERLPGKTQTQLPAWLYIANGSNAYPLNGVVSQQITPPSEADTISIDANGGNIYYAINSPTAGTNSPGFIPDGGGRSIGPISDFQSISIYSDTNGAIAHIQFWKEV